MHDRIALQERRSDSASRGDGMLTYGFDILSDSVTDEGVERGGKRLSWVPKAAKGEMGFVDALRRMGSFESRE